MHSAYSAISSEDFFSTQLAAEKPGEVTLAKASPSTSPAVEIRSHPNRPEGHSARRGRGPYEVLRPGGLNASGQTQVGWLWHGYLRPGSVTLLTSLWKSGKTTLISVLLSKLKAGGELAGLPLSAGKALIVSEEPPSKWEERNQILAFGDHLSWICRPFAGKPGADQWRALIDQIVGIHQEHGMDLVVIDSLANLAPYKSENEACEMLRTLLPLQSLTNVGMSVLLSAHPSKGKSLGSQAARGSGALPGFVDIIVEMSRVSPGNVHDRRRRLKGYSRYAATPPVWVIELTADGVDYRALGETAEPDFAHGWPLVKEILKNAARKLSRLDILRLWPENRPRPKMTTLWKWLERLVQERKVLQEGVGRKKDPFVYWLPGMEDKWHQDFLQSLLK